MKLNKKEQEIKNYIESTDDDRFENPKKSSKKYVKKITRKINTFESFEEDENEEIYDVKSNVESILGEKFLEFDILVDENENELVVELSKSNECFNSTRLDTHFKGKNKDGFMGDFSILEEMHEQLTLIDELIGEISELGLTYNRCYIEDNSIYIDFYL
jgi:hypothetical protein